MIKFPGNIYPIGYTLMVLLGGCESFAAKMGQDVESVRVIHDKANGVASIIGGEIESCVVLGDLKDRNIKLEFVDGQCKVIMGE
jgi:hypothetical protein